MCTLIVGQGIAGSLVAFMLHRHALPFVVIDPGHATTSSRIAAGMFTPVSGKRNTVAEGVSQKISFAVEVYREIEQLLGTTILHCHNIYHVYSSASEAKEFTGKLANAGHANYFITDPKPVAGISQEAGACEITHSGWVDCKLFTERFAQWLKQHDALIEEEFLYEDLNIRSRNMEYHGMYFSNIIFCEGHIAGNNPFFKEEVIIPCKGDILTIEYDHLSHDRIIKKNGIYIIPVIDNIFRVGSTYQWNNNSTAPDEKGKKLIAYQLDNILEKKYITLDHQAAIRPTTKTRAVIAKQHSKHTGMFMLNGLGTKGVLQGPWFAKFVVGILLKGESAGTE